jgi:hypothetical protein
MPKEAFMSPRSSTNGDNQMNATKPENRYTITFPGERPMTFTKEKIQSPTLLNAIAYIEREPGCSGLTLENGTQIDIA